MSDIKETILQKLMATEKDYFVKIPFAIESGSRGWGFASPDSDYDCRFIYLRPVDWYLSVLDKKDIIEYTADSVFDINGWDIKKVIQHIIKSNAVMFEWLSSNEVYIKNEYITNLLISLFYDFFNPISVSYHYLSIAKNKLAEVLNEDTAKLKHYFYILRPIINLNYINQHNKMPYMEFDRTLAEVDIPNEILSEIQSLKEKKIVSNERYKIKRNELLITYFLVETRKFDDILNGMKHQKKRDYEKADFVFRAIIERAWSDEN